MIAAQVPTFVATATVDMRRPTWYTRHAVVLEEGPRPQPLGQVTRVARLLALAHHFERLLAEGIVRTQGELAALALGDAPPRDPDPEPAPLGPPTSRRNSCSAPAERGPEPITERALRYVLRTPLWREQRARWAEIREA